MKKLLILSLTFLLSAQAQKSEPTLYVKFVESFASTHLREAETFKLTGVNAQCFISNWENAQVASKTLYVLVIRTSYSDTKRVINLAARGAFAVRGTSTIPPLPKSLVCPKTLNATDSAF